MKSLKAHNHCISWQIVKGRENHLLIRSWKEMTVERDVMAADVPISSFIPSSVNRQTN